MKLYRNIHFIGCGGVGMAGVAHIAADLGCRVTGSDIANSAMTASLEKRGITICHGHGQSLPPDTELVVYSSAVPESDLERTLACQANIPQMRRGEFLALLARTSFQRVVAIGGSHGKTTTTAMTAHILQKAGVCPGYMVGGNVVGWERNASAGNEDVLVTEADESDGTQALLDTTVAAVLNIDDDHFWSLGGKDKLAECFRTFASRGRNALAFADDEKTLDILKDLPQLQTVVVPDGIRLPIPGDFNRRNAAMAVRIAELLGIDRTFSIQALADYPGVERRMSCLHRSANGLGIVIEDYAHHPTELAALLKTVSTEYPGSDIIAYFQPHRFERLEFFGERFAALLANYCTKSVIVTPFAAWNENAHGISADMLVSEINRLRENSARLAPCEPEKLAREILDGADAASASKVTLIIGAGDIGKIRNSIETLKHVVS